MVRNLEMASQPKLEESYTGRNSATVVPVEMVESLLVGGRLDVLLVLDQLLLLKLYHLGHLLEATYETAKFNWTEICHELRPAALFRPCLVSA